MRFISVLFILFLLSCKGKDKRYIAPGSLSAKDSLYTIVDSAGMPSYLFHFAPAYSTTYYYTVETKASVQQEIMEKKMETTSDYTVAFHYNIVRNQDSSKKLTLTYDNFTLKGKTGNTEVDIDAAHTEEDAPEAMFRMLKGARFTAQVSPSGNISTITGIKELQDSMYKYSGNDPEQRQLVQSTVNKIITEESLKQMLGPGTSAFPKKTIHIGDSWKVNSTTLQSDFKLPITTTYTLREVENGIATISINATIRLDNQEVQVQTYNATASFTGTQKGELKIDMVMGTVESSEQEINVKGKFEVLGNEVPIVLNYKNSINREQNK